MSYRIGIDIGGTFTDFTIARDSGELILWKEDTTPQDPGQAVLTGLAAVSEQLGTDTRGLLQETELFVHGTTVATNMLIQRNGPKIGLLCTEGFRDVLYFRDGYKPERFNLHLEHPEELVDRWLRIGVPGRFDATGNETTPLDESAVHAAATRFREAGVQAVAVAFLWSMLHPEHELRAAEILREELPGVDVLCSHVVLPEIREWERTSATVMSAYILPRISEYLTNLQGQLAGGGLDSPPLIMQINGGCARIPDILRVPVNILASGPAAAPAAALHFAPIVGNDLITVDMGGTSLDVCLIRDGRATMSREMQVEDQPIGVPAVDVHSVGAGGGSIGWIDPGGALRVGPRSAGSRPGPACYDFGGTEPTVTDANVVLGYLDPDAFLGGRRRLRDDLSRAAVETVGEPLGLSATEAAAGIIRVVNANMVGAIRAVSIDRGVDPRRFTLVCGGGAGGLHAAELARELGMDRVFVPLEAGVFCSFGMTVTDVRHDHVAALHGISDAFSLDTINSVLTELEERARQQLLEEGFEDAEIVLERSVDARYPGQVHEITVNVPASTPFTMEDVRVLELTFHEQHLAQFAYNRDGLPIETLHWRVAAIGRSAHGADVEVAESDGSEIVPVRTTRAYSVARAEMVETPIYEAADLGLGGSVHGPAIFAAPTTTIVIHEGDVLSRDVAQGFTIDVAPKARDRAAATATPERQTA